MTLAILCSGQGLQDAQMFTLTAHASAAADLFLHASRLLDGRDPRVMVQEASAAELHENRVGQILCTLQSLAAARILRDALPAQFMLAGYSVGEVAAWGVAKIFDGSTTLDLVARRAELMDAHSNPGDGLVFVRGLSRCAIDELCRRYDAAVAIINPGDAYVIGGAARSLEALMDAAQRAGAERTRRLDVKVASHTRFLSDAAAAFRAVVDNTPGTLPRRGIRLFTGVDGSALGALCAGKGKLACQISHPVQWSACVAGCVEAGASHFLELGPGCALSDMVNSAYPQIPARNLSDFKTAAGACNWLDRAQRS